MRQSRTQLRAETINLPEIGPRFLLAEVTSDYRKQLSNFDFQVGHIFGVALYFHLNVR